MTAGIYASRRNLKNLIITKDIGGQASTTNYVENYPGYEKVGGFELMQKFQKQAESFGSQFKYEEIISVDKLDNKFAVKTTANNQYRALSLILTFGKTPSNLNVEGEKEFTGRGVSYCATCDGPLYKNKTVAIIGGGNAALESADYLGQICQKVYLIHRRNEFRAEEVLVDRVKNLKNVEIILEKIIAKISGDKFVKAIEIEDVNTKEKREITVDGIFIEIGHTVDATPIKQLVKVNSNNEIIVDVDCATSEAGIFAAGDVTNIKYKQIVISAGEGAKAALSAYKYIQHIKGLKEPIFDWGKK